MKKISRTSFIAAILLGASAFAAAATDAGSPQAQFDAANAALEKENLDGALETYQSLVRQGYESAALFYNLGNIAYRKGERGKAVLWYERAHRLAPRDSDIEFNLSLARSHLRDEHENPFIRPLTFLTPGELGWTLTLFVWVFFGLLGATIVGWIPMDSLARVALWLSGATLAITAAWFVGAAIWAAEPQAIVVSPPGEVRNGPGTDYAVGFTVPEGSKVDILNTRPDWTQVGVPQQGLKGWMPSAEVEPISPGLGVRAG